MSYKDSIFPRHCLRASRGCLRASAVCFKLLVGGGDSAVSWVLLNIPPILTRAASINRAEDVISERPDNETQGHESSSARPTLKGRAKLQGRETFHSTGAQCTAPSTRNVSRFHFVSSGPSLEICERVRALTSSRSVRARSILRKFLGKEKKRGKKRSQTDRRTRLDHKEAEKRETRPRNLESATNSWTIRSAGEIPVYFYLDNKWRKRQVDVMMGKQARR